VTRSGKKTVRFTRVVERSGQPHVHTLWVAPEKDPELKRARETNRVMVLERSGGTAKTDVGAVGFDPVRDKGAQLLIFPKSLKPFEDARVIGIKFDLLEQPEVIAATGDESRSKHSGAAGQRRETRATSEADDAHDADGGHTSAQNETKLAADHEGDADHEHVRAARGDRSTAPSRPPSKQARREKKSDDGPEKPPPSVGPLLREVHAAMKELERGKAVAAYHRLERAVAKAEK
jgi:hypothetical protein